jgi:hypothetical protein
MSRGMSPLCLPARAAISGAGTARARLAGPEAVPAFPGPRSGGVHPRTPVPLLGA